MILNYKLMIHDERLEGKTHILTQDSDWNDPINHRIQGFSFRNFENDRQCSRDEFSLINQRNLNFNHSVDAEMGIEAIRSERFKDRCV